MNVDPGELNKQIKIVTCFIGNDNGFPRKLEQKVRDCWAKVTEESGSEKLKAGAELGERKARFFVRTSGRITRDMKVRYKGELFDIEYLREYDGGYTELIGVVRS